MTVKNLFVLINVLYKFWLVFDEFYYKLPTTSFLTISEGILFQKLILWSPNLDHLLLRYLLFVCIGIHAMIRVLQHAHKFSIFNFQITPCPTQNLQKYYSALRNLILDTFYQLKPIIFYNKTLNVRKGNFQLICQIRDPCVRKFLQKYFKSAKPSGNLELKIVILNGDCRGKIMWSQEF